MYQEKLTMLLVPLSCPPCSVIAVIAATLFPLWPAEMRVGVYYLSVGAGCFVASILLLAVGECGQRGPRARRRSPALPGLGAGRCLLPGRCSAAARPILCVLPSGQRVSQLCHGKRAQARVTCWCFLSSADSFTASA